MTSQGKQGRNGFFGLFGQGRKDGKKFKPADMGNAIGGDKDGGLYYNAELKLWVERGKEDEAQPAVAPPPPPRSRPAPSSDSTATLTGQQKGGLDSKYAPLPGMGDVPPPSSSTFSLGGAGPPSQTSTATAVKTFVPGAPAENGAAPASNGASQQPKVFIPGGAAPAGEDEATSAPITNGAAPPAQPSSQQQPSIFVPRGGDSTPAGDDAVTSTPMAVEPTSTTVAAPAPAEPPQTPHGTGVNGFNLDLQTAAPSPKAAPLDVEFGHDPLAATPQHAEPDAPGYDPGGAPGEMMQDAAMYDEYGTPLQAEYNPAEAAPEYTLLPCPPLGELPAFEAAYSYGDWSADYWHALYEGDLSRFYFHWMRVRQLEGWTDADWEVYAASEPEHYEYIMYYCQEWQSLGYLDGGAGAASGGVEGHPEHSTQPEPVDLVDQKADPGATVTEDLGHVDHDLLDVAEQHMYAAEQQQPSYTEAADAPLYRASAEYAHAEAGDAALQDAPEAVATSVGMGAYEPAPDEALYAPETSATGPGIAEAERSHQPEADAMALEEPARNTANGITGAGASQIQFDDPVATSRAAAKKAHEAGTPPPAAPNGAVAVDWADPDDTALEPHSDTLLNKYREFFRETEGPAGSELPLTSAEDDTGGLEGASTGAGAEAPSITGDTAAGDSEEAEQRRAQEHLEKSLPAGLGGHAERSGGDGDRGGAYSHGAPSDRDAAERSTHMSDAQSEAASSVFVQPPSLHAPSEVPEDDGATSMTGPSSLVLGGPSSLMTMVIPEQPLGPMDDPVTDDVPKLPPMFGEVPHADRPEINLGDLERTGMRIGEHSPSCRAEAASTSALSENGNDNHHHHHHRRGRYPRSNGPQRSTGDREEDEGRTGGARSCGGSSRHSSDESTSTDDDRHARAPAHHRVHSSPAAPPTSSGADPAAMIRQLAPRMADLQGALSRAVAGGVFVDLDLANRFQELQERNGFLLDELQSRKLTYGTQYDVEYVTPHPSHPATPLKSDGWDPRLRTPGNLSDMSTPKPTSNPESSPDAGLPPATMRASGYTGVNSNPLFGPMSPQHPVVDDVKADVASLRHEISRLQLDNDRLAQDHDAMRSQLAESQADLQAAHAELAVARDELRERDERIDAMAAQIASLQSQLSDAAHQPSTSAAAEELADVQRELAEKEGEFDELLACLGLESARLGAVKARLAEFGVDVDVLIDEVDETHGWEEEDDEDGEAYTDDDAV